MENRVTAPIASAPSDRCRLVLVLDAARHVDGRSDRFVRRLDDALAAGDVASVVFASGSLPEAGFQESIAPIVPAVQDRGVAVIVCDHTRVAGRLKADGIQLGQDPSDLQRAIETHRPAMMVGAGNVRTRHMALTLGELEPDYLMFGKPGGDTQPQTNPKNLELGRWWAALVEIPCITLGGNHIDSVVEVAQSGVEFVALSDAIFAPQEGDSQTIDLAERVRSANAKLDQHAPRFESA